MTTITKSQDPGQRSLPSEPPPVDASEHLEHLGVVDSDVAHGGHPRRSSRPPVAAGIVQRAPSPVLLETKVRSVRLRRG